MGKKRMMHQDGGILSMPKKKKVKKNPDKIIIIQLIQEIHESTLPDTKPLFDTREMLNSPNPDNTNYIQTLGIPAAEKEHQLCKEVFKSYANSNDTFTAYRREVERLLHWDMAGKKSFTQRTNS